MKNKVFLSLGSNIGDPVKNCLKAIESLNNNEDIKVISQSSLYETEPVGYEEQSSFVNMAVGINTSLHAESLLVCIKKIEKTLGRVETFRWGPRLIDVDILLYNQEIIKKPGLAIPHPAMSERAFVLIPLSEIGGNIKHPVEKMTILDMTKKVPGKEGVRRIEVLNEDY